ncbi:MAG: thiamine phosphate synthase [Castellaniella sp.]|uniref:thiamine phosphate synthase n=1 Tax=Castellaniella sp. TaxID=1955812 RepID=UPI002A36896D|nr:thiamine phosphate synthase [Castellaniella sp.]MDY0308562.1 thiamine phosphate synthase [Castellaniella sp.]
MNAPDALRFPRGLYGITPDWADTDRLLTAIEHAHAGGMTALQWRRKHGAPADLRIQARAVRDLCLRLGLPLIINDDWRLAADLDADGAHLGRDDGVVTQARRALGPDKLLGCSCYDQPDLAAQRLRDDADYVAFGALYPSSVKPGAVRATLDQIRAGRHLADTHASRSPAGGMRRAAIVAIGGITPDNAAPVIQAGADSIAIISALFEAPDIRAAARRCAALFGAPLS